MIQNDAEFYFREMFILIYMTQDFVCKSKFIYTESSEINVHIYLYIIKRFTNEI